MRWCLGGPSGRAEYTAGHLSGVVFVDLDTELAVPPGPAERHPLPEAADLERVSRAAGVRRDRAVVVYDADNGSVAPRAWRLLRWSGHTDVAVLYGGHSDRVTEGGPGSTEVPSPDPSNVEVRPGAMPVLDADAAATSAGTGDLLDARAPERHWGEVEPVDPRAGHVPGAVNAPFAGHVGPDGRWPEPTAQVARFAGLGVVAGGRVGACCGSGVTASSVVPALEVAGVTEVGAPAALCAGSWSAWSADPDRPAPTGHVSGH